MVGADSQHMIPPPHCATLSVMMQPAMLDAEEDTQ